MSETRGETYIAIVSELARNEIERQALERAALAIEASFVNTNATYRQAVKKCIRLVRDLKP